MKYRDGREAAVGDRVKLWDGMHGTVVASIDTGEFTAGYPEAEWADLKSGVLIRTDSGDLFRYTEPDEDFELIGRGIVP